jgi:phosphohistidine phosphatase
LILYILRHGEAEPKGKKLDEERALTSEGAAMLEKGLKIAKAFGVEASKILSSPLLRARQSAEIAAKVFGIANTSISNSLEPESTPEEVYSELQTLNSDDGVILVLHQPLASKLLSDLLGAVNVEMSTGSFARVDFKRFPKTGEGRLVFLIPGFSLNTS